jgi:CHAT domain-containing protein
VAFVKTTGSDDPVLVSLGDAATIDDLVDRWRSRMAQPASSASGTRDNRSLPGDALRVRVWDPVRSLLGEPERIFVVPDGALHLVNLAALPTDDGGYVVEQGTVIHYTSAERDLVGASRQPQTGRRSLLALGGLKFGGRTLLAEPSALSVATDEAPPEDDATALLASVVLPTAGEGEITRRSACGRFEELVFDELPGTDREVGAVSRLWKEAAPDAGETILRGAAADEAAFKEAASEHRYLHLATHGFFLGRECVGVEESRGIGALAAEPAESEKQQPPQPSTTPATTIVGENPLLLAGLALAGANDRQSAGPDEEDGILTAEEIAALDLSGVEWAVLSACDTGVGDIRAGEGVFGLRRAFQVAGARTLIMSLWSVDDEATRQWMTALYEVRLKRGTDTATAVTEASLTVLQSRREAGESTHPFYWGAFVAAGDWR